MKDLIKYIDKEKILKIFTAIILAIAMLIYEFAFCNTKFIEGILNKEIVSYNFSLVRLVIYVLYAYLYFKYINKFTKNALKSLKNKYKIAIMIIVYVIFGGVFISTTVTHMIYYKIILMVLNLLLGTIFLIYISNDFRKNLIIMFVTLGLLFCCTTQFNGSLDEKRHFMSAFNISIGNFNYKRNNKTEESIEQIPRICSLKESKQFFEKKYKNKIYDNNEVDINLRATTYSFLLYLPSAIGIKLATILQGSIADIYIVRKNF